MLWRKYFSTQNKLTAFDVIKITILQMRKIELPRG